MPSKPFSLGRTKLKALSIGLQSPAAAPMVSLNARPDRIDLRDRVYQPRLVNLPPESPSPKLLQRWVPAYKKLVLDQGKAGSCTGFGLAGVINHLIFRETKLNKRKFAFQISSPGMLYRLARIYDEWPGDDYEGSSCRGAMKGWHKHGVCSWKSWPYSDKKPNANPTAKNWEDEALQIPLGAYYRVDKNAINDMQSAIHEVGAIYVSAEMHQGWAELYDNQAGHTKGIPKISFSPDAKKAGHHAFAIVGYTPEGFIVQNSWGASWGLNGFAILTHADWLKNGADAWVAVMGAARTQNSSAARGSGVRGTKGRAGWNVPDLPNEAEGKHPGAWNKSDTLRHTIILGNNGWPERRNVGHASGAESVTAAANEYLVEWASGRKEKTIHLALYAHGGLNSEDSSLTRISLMGPWFEANGIYPVFFTWKTGPMETIGNLLDDKITQWLGGGEARSQSWIGDKLAELKKQAQEATDRMIESACHEVLARAAWTEMKSNAGLAARPEGGLSLAAEAMKSATAAIEKMGKELHLHLIGHSAGSILLGHALDIMAQQKVIARSLHLYAPACTVEFANQHYGPALAAKGVLDPKHCSSFVHNLTLEAELADTVGPYGKSLVYLIHRALEPEHKTPILGMQPVWEKMPEVIDLFPDATLNIIKEWRKCSQEVKTAFYGLDHKAFDGKDSTTPKHGTFDNDVRVINQTLRRILQLKDGQDLPAPVTWLAGF
jgi:hypothetical protein